jgi:glyoxylase-like metal-dependent hydrolase (beta-lactamase superfamily II)
MAEPREIARDVYWLRIAIANVYFVRSGGHWVLVDTAIPNRSAVIRAAADSLFGAGAKPHSILLTHGHMDHSGSAVELARGWNVPVYIGERELPFVTGEIPYPPPDPSVGGFMAFLTRLFPIRKINLEGVPVVFPENEVPGLPDWKLIATPGHAPGQVAFFRPADGVLIGGDALTTVNLDSFFDLVSGKQEISRPPAPITCDWEAAKRSVETLAALRPMVLACGHGTPMSGAKVAEELEAFAREFPVPERGRYVARPYAA